MKKLLITAFMVLFSFSSQCGTIVINPIFYIMNKIMGTSSIQGSGIPKTQHLPIEGIRHISASGMGNLFIQQCENPHDCIEKLIITADDNILDLLQQKKCLDKLELSTKNNVSLSIKTPIQYHATVKSIHSIFQSGSINITAESIATETLTVSSSGNSTITLEGSTNHQEIRMSGHTNYQAKNLESNSISFSCFGSANIDLNAKEEIKGSMYGNASGTYDGKHSPEVNVQKYGSARFKKSS